VAQFFHHLGRACKCGRFEFAHDKTVHICGKRKRIRFAQPGDDFAVRSSFGKRQFGQGSDNSQLQKLKQIAATEGSNVVLVSAQVESEIMQLDKDEREIFLEELGLKHSGLQTLVNFLLD